MTSRFICPECGRRMTMQSLHVGGYGFYKDFMLCTEVGCCYGIELKTDADYAEAQRFINNHGGNYESEICNIATQTGEAN